MTDPVRSWTEIAGESPEGPSEVLVVDDDADLAKTYAELLADRYDVRTATTGIEAIALLTDSVDLVVLDRNLGAWTGEILLGVMQERRLDCAVLVVTGTDPGLDVANLPVDDYLTKPVDPNVLRESVAELLFRKRCPRTEQELLACISRRAALETAHSREELESSVEYAQLNCRIEIAQSLLAVEPTAIGQSKYRPDTCPNCGLRWDVSLGSTVGFSTMSAFVWKCTECRTVESLSSPERRSVARR